MKIYINGIGSVSFQENSKGADRSSMQKVEQGLNDAKQPSYKEIIAPAMVRRMAKGVKMGIYASTEALKEAEIAVPDAVISGTGFGCSIDSEKFLIAMLENNESYLTPTSFIQSTHNTVGAQIALHLKCTGYNFTYVHQNTSFESALLDAYLQIKAGELGNALVGGVDEMGATTMHFYQLIQKANTAEEQFEKGVNFSEGATFMMLDNKPTDNVYGEIVDIAISNNIADLSSFISAFLKQNNCSNESIDMVLLGENNTANDGDYFKQVRNMFSDSVIETYKEFSGEYYTASAFGLQIACELLKKQHTFSTNQPREINYILVYNQFDGTDHSLILLKK